MQRSDLLGAVVGEVPLLDMKRFHKLLAGSSWIAEYGDPDTKDWEYLKNYSPYHRIDRYSRIHAETPLRLGAPSTASVVGAAWCLQLYATSLRRGASAQLLATGAAGLRGGERFNGSMQFEW